MLTISILYEHVFVISHEHMNIRADKLTKLIHDTIFEILFVLCVKDKFLIAN